MSDGRLRCPSQFSWRILPLCYNSSMAGRGVSALLFFVKWVIVPVGLAALGFFVVGPRIGTDESVLGSLPPGRTAFGVDFGKKDEPPGATTPGPRSVRRSGEPEVDVSVRPATSRRERQPTEERRRAPAPPPEEVPEGVGGNAWEDDYRVPDFAPVPDPVPFTDPKPEPDPPDQGVDPD